MTTHQNTLAIKPEGFDGVTVFAHRISYGRRSAFQAAIAQLNADIRPAYLEWDRLGEVEEQTTRDGQKLERSPEQLLEIEALIAKLKEFQRKHDTIMLKHFFKRVDGLVIEDYDGEITAEVFLNEAPEELALQVIAELRKQVKPLEGAEAKNSERPSTSSAQVDGPTLVTIAPTASVEPTI